MNASQDWSNLRLQTGDLVSVRMPGAPHRVGMVARIGHPPAGSLQILRIEVILGNELLVIDKYHLERMEGMTPEDERAFNEMNELFTDMGVWKLRDEGRPGSPHRLPQPGQPPNPMTSDTISGPRSIQ